MRISRIGSLFAANIDAVSSHSSINKTKISEQTSRNDAVVVSEALYRAPQDSATTDEARAARLRELKEQVVRGSYTVASDKVARALWRDLA